MIAALRFAILAAFALLATPGIAATAHSGAVVRDGFELSDLALFIAAAFGVWFVRHSLRKRFRRRKQD